MCCSRFGHRSVAYPQYKIRLGDDKKRNNMKKVKKVVQDTPATGKTFSDEELAAMRERAKELRANKTDGEKEVLEKIAAMPEPDRTLAKRLHTIIRESAPILSPKTWYGMPAYADKDGKVVCF